MRRASQSTFVLERYMGQRLRGLDPNQAYSSVRIRCPVPIPCESDQSWFKFTSTCLANVCVHGTSFACGHAEAWTRTRRVCGRVSSKLHTCRRMESTAYSSTSLDLTISLLFCTERQLQVTARSFGISGFCVDRQPSQCDTAFGTPTAMRPAKRFPT